MAKEEHAREFELIVVFKKYVTVERAEEVLRDNGVTVYREGMDSSKGKIYFYSTGPKFIVTFSSLEQKEKFAGANKNHKDIHEIYTPDWNLQKD